VACQWNISSPTGPAEQLAGGSLPKSTSSVVHMRMDWNCCDVGVVGKHKVIRI